MDNILVFDILVTIFFLHFVNRSVRRKQQMLKNMKMTKKMKLTNISQLACLIAVSVTTNSQAATVSILDLNTADTGNTANVGGVATNLTVSRAGDGTTSGDYVYSVSYTNQSFDGDSTLDTLTFDVRVVGFSGGTIQSGSPDNSTNDNNTTSSAIIGTTSEEVNIAVASTIDAWYVGSGSNTMAVGQTLAFSLENFSVTTSMGSYMATVSSFDQVTNQERAGRSHATVIGQGASGLQGRTWSNNIPSQDTMNFTQSPELFVSSALLTSVGGTESPGNQWGVASLDFTVDVSAVPEPSSALLLGLGGSALLLRRRK